MLARGHLKSEHYSKGCVRLEPGSQNVIDLSGCLGAPSRVAIWLCDHKLLLSFSGPELTHYEMRMWTRAGVFTLCCWRRPPRISRDAEDIDELYTS